MASLERRGRGLSKVTTLLALFCACQGGFGSDSVGGAGVDERVAAIIAVSPSLYIEQDGKLWRADGATGDFVPVPGPVTNADWSGATSMATLDQALYVVLNSQLHKVDPSSGVDEILGGPDWGGPTSMVKMQNTIYLTQDDGLWRTALPTALYDRVGTADWSGTTSMTSFGGWLYIIRNSRLHKVSPNRDGTPVVLGSPVWGGPTLMTATKEAIYVIQGDRLWKITDPLTGSFKRHGTRLWPGATSMTSLDGWLYVVQDSQLYKVNAGDGSDQVLGGRDWGGPTRMAGLPVYNVGTGGTPIGTSSGGSGGSGGAGGGGGAGGR
jgi:hypothetical protein